MLRRIWEFLASDRFRFNLEPEMGGAARPMLIWPPIFGVLVTAFVIYLLE